MRLLAAVWNGEVTSKVLRVCDLGLEAKAKGCEGVTCEGVDRCTTRTMLATFRTR